MALLDKIGEFAKIAANKTEEITKTIGEKAEAALEIQKLTSLVGKEESKIESTYKPKKQSRKKLNRKPKLPKKQNLLTNNN